MKKNTNILAGKDLDLNFNDNQLDVKDSKTKEIDLHETVSKGVTTKPESKLSKSIHTKPADEQQFENNI